MPAPGGGGYPPGAEGQLAGGAVGLWSPGASVRWPAEVGRGCGLPVGWLGVAVGRAARLGLALLARQQRVAVRGHLLLAAAGGGDQHAERRVLQRLARVVTDAGAVGVAEADQVRRRGALRLGRRALARSAASEGLPVAWADGFAAGLSWSGSVPVAAASATPPVAATAIAVAPTFRVRSFARAVSSIEQLRLGGGNADVPPGVPPVQRCSRPGRREVVLTREASRGRVGITGCHRGPTMTPLRDQSTTPQVRWSEGPFMHLVPLSAGRRQDVTPLPSAVKHRPPATENGRPASEPTRTR